MSSTARLLQQESFLRLMEQSMKSTRLVEPASWNRQWNRRMPPIDGVSYRHCFRSAVPPTMALINHHHIVAPSDSDEKSSVSLHRVCSECLPHTLPFQCVYRRSSSDELTKLFNAVTVGWASAQAISLFFLILASFKKLFKFLFSSLFQVAFFQNFSL